MPGFRHILFPVDFSDRCAAVRAFVTHLANKSRAKVTLLHAFDKPGSFCAASEGAFSAALDPEQMCEESCTMLSDFFPGEPEHNFEMARAAVCGDPANAIVEFARNNGVDLIMLPTHGHGIFHRLLLGSVTSEILDAAPCAVWTAAHTEDPAMPSHATCRTIVLAVTATPEEAQTVRRAADVCEAFSEKLLLLHSPKDAAAVEGARRQVDDLQRAAQTALEVVIEPGNCAEVAARFACQKNADLLILGRGPLRAKAREIIRHARCPVLSL